MKFEPIEQFTGNLCLKILQFEFIMSKTTLPKKSEHVYKKVDGDFMNFCKHGMNHNDYEPSLYEYISSLTTKYKYTT